MSRAFARRRPRPLPGFRLTFGLTLAYLALVVLIPLGALVLRAARLGLPGVVHIALDTRVRAVQPVLEELDRERRKPRRRSAPCGPTPFAASSCRRLRPPP